MKKTIFTVSAMLMLLAPAGAESPTPAPKPHAPYVAGVPALAAWTVTLSYHRPEGNSPPSPESKAYVPDGYPIQIKTVRTGTSFQFTVTEAGGASSQYDKIGSYLVIPDGAGFRLSLADPSLTPFQYYTTDFLFADWVRAAGEAAFAGIEARDGVKCFHFRGPGAREAWVSVETMLPVAARDDALTEATFTFLPPPAAPLDFPANVLAAIARHQQVLKAFNSIR